MQLEHFLILSALLFAIGFALVVTRKNSIVVLMGIELIFNAANLNLIAFNRYDPHLFQGLAFSLFVIVIAACEVAIALAIILNIYKRFQTINLDRINQMNG
ncbi:MAG: NADH-quinone oxidoreductase subunit NuoK [Bacteroidota bacterium]